MVRHGAFAYTWDLVGDPSAAARIAGLGVDTVTLQAAYHSVRATTAWHPAHRVVHADHAAAYFRIRPERWRGLRPLPPSWGVEDEDPFGTATAALKAHIEDCPAGRKAKAPTTAVTWPLRTKGRRRHGAQSDARLRQRMQGCTPHGRRSPGLPILGVYRAAPHGSAANYPQPIGSDRVRHLTAPRPDTFGPLAAHSRRTAGSTTGPRARKQAAARDDSGDAECGVFQGFPLQRVTTLLRHSYGGARLIIVRSVVRIHPEL